MPCYSKKSSSLIITHALLCRTYTKGRDWYDFLWYVNRSIQPNFELLTNAIDQAGPGKGQSIHITPKWFIEQLRETIQAIDWTNAKNENFSPKTEKTRVAYLV